MKNLTKRFLNKFRKTKLTKQVSNERGQGMLEYILLVVVIVGLVITAKKFFEPKMEEIKGKLSEAISGVTGG